MLSELIQLLMSVQLQPDLFPRRQYTGFADSPYWFGPPLKSQVKYWSTKFASVLLIQIDNQTQEGAWKMTRKQRHSWMPRSTVRTKGSSG